MRAKTKKTQSKTLMDATILFADMVDSSMLSHILEPFRYDKLISSFQSTAARVVAEILQELAPCGSHIEAAVRGDEMSLIVGAEVESANRTARVEQLHCCARLALQAAINLKRQWLLAPENKSRILNGQPPLGIAVGIHAGPVVVQRHARFDLGPVSPRTKEIVTAEGYAINTAKRVETASRLGRFSRIFLTRPIFNRTPSDFRQAFIRVDVSELKGIPVSPVIYEAKGIGHFDDKAFPKSPVFDDDENLKIFEKVVQANPNEIWLLLDLAHKYFDVGEYDLAAQKYKSVIEVDPDFAPAYAYLGRAQMRHCRFHEAQAALERAVELDKNQARSNHYLAVCLRRRAILAYQKNEIEKARELFDKTLEYHERSCRIVDLEEMDFPWAENGYNYTVAQASQISDFPLPIDLDGAFKRSQVLLRQCAQSPEWLSKRHLIHHTMGFIRLQQKEYTSAMKYLRMAEADLDSRMKDRTSAPDKKGYAERKAEILFHIGLCGYRGRNAAELRNAAEVWRSAKGIVAEAWGPYARKACEGQYWMHYRVKTPDQIVKTVAQVVEE